MGMRSTYMHVELAVHWPLGWLTHTACACPCPFAGNLRTTSSQLSLEGSDDLRSEGSSSFVAGAGAGGFGADWAAAEAPSIDLNQLQDAFPALPASSTP